MKKIRILFVIYHMDFGGAQKALLNLLSCMDSNRYEIDLLLLDKRGAYLPYIPEYVHILPQAEGMKQATAPFMKDVSSQLKQGHFSAAFARVAYACRKRIVKTGTLKYSLAQQPWSYLRKVLPPLPGTYDVAVGFLQGICNYYVAEKVTARRKIGWLHTDYITGGYRPDFAQPYLNRLDAVAGVSPAVISGLAACFPDQKDKFQTVLNIIPCEMTRRLSREPGGFSDDNFSGIRLLTIGRLSPEKNYDFAVKACAELVRRGHNVRWYVLGEGPLKEQIQQWIAESKMENHFFLLGTNPNPYPYLRQCNIFVQPSRFEGSSMVLTEAKVLGKPCVATCYDSVNDQLVHEQTGIITEMTYQSVADGVERLILDPQLRHRLEENLSGFRGTESEIVKYDALFTQGL